MQGTETPPPPCHLRANREGLPSIMAPAPTQQSASISISSRSALLRQLCLLIGSDSFPVFPGANTRTFKEDTQLQPNMSESKKLGDKVPTWSFWGLSRGIKVTTPCSPISNCMTQPRQKKPRKILHHTALEYKTLSPTPPAATQFQTTQSVFVKNISELKRMAKPYRKLESNAHLRP